MQIIEILESLDLQFFLFLNSFHSEFWDEIMVFVSKKFVWIPLYFSVLVVLYRQFGWKKTLILLVFFVGLIALADQISLFLKNTTHRFRPYHDERIADVVHYVKKSAGKYGFVSGHAANSFAFAIFSALIIKNKAFTIGIIFWAAIVSYSRIYLAAHFPGDVLGGIILGSLLAWFLFKFYNFTQKRRFKPNKLTNTSQ